jgi:4-hydroxybenzoate polyprenyltransferase
MSTAHISISQRVKNYLSLIRFSHTVFALPFACIGFTLGVIQDNKPFDWLVLVKMLLCMVFARSAAMSFNRYLDRHFDALNPRTAKREVPAGIITAQNALLFTIINAVLFCITTWFINALCFYLSFVALFIILFYSYTKRFTALCHIVLGIGLSLSPIGAYLAVTGHFSLVPLLFSFSVLTWVSGFDIMYALQDEEFDRKNNLHSIPALLGIKNALLVSVFLHIVSACFIIAAGYMGHFNWVYWLGAFFYCSLLVYQHLLVKPSDLSKVNMAFANTNGIASVVFGSLTILSLLF